MDYTHSHSTAHAINVTALNGRMCVFEYRNLFKTDKLKS